jgi:hypothetical protein
VLAPVLSFKRRADRQRPSTEEQKVEVRTLARLSEGATFCGPIHERIEENNCYVAPPAGGMWKEEDRERNEARERPSLVDNKILPAINSVSGQEMMGRYVPRIFSRTRDSQSSGVAEILDATSLWVREEADTDHEVSLAFRQALIGGYGCIHKYFDHLENDGEGQIKDREIYPGRMIWDGSAMGQNLHDRRWHMHGEWLPEDEVPLEWLEALPSAAGRRKGRKGWGPDTLEDWHTQAGGSGSRWPWSAIANGAHHNKAEREVFVLRHEWREREEAFRAAVPVELAKWEEAAQTGQVDLDGEIVDLTQMDEPQLLEIRDYLLAQTKIETMTRKQLSRLRERYLMLTGERFEDYASMERWRFRYAWMVNGHIVEVGDIPVGKFTYSFITCFPWPSADSTVYYGMVDLAKGGQDFRNRFLSLALAILSVSPKEGWVVEESALGPWKDEFANDIARPGGIATVPDGFFATKRSEKMAAPNFPDFLPGFIGIADQAVTAPFGLSGALMGGQADLRRVSGQAVSQIREAASTVMSLPFDSLKRQRREDGKLQIAFIVEYIPVEMIAEVAGPDKARYIPMDAMGQPLPKAEWLRAARLRVKVDEAPVTQEERKETFDFLTRTMGFQEWMQLMPIEVLAKMIPTIQESDREAIIQHTKQKEALPQMMQLLQDPQIAEYVQSTPEGANLLQLFAQQQQAA